jgi:hypothetical protein
LVSRSREDDLRALQSIYEAECARVSRQTFHWDHRESVPVASFRS